jgi:peptidyl-prolyl cis-trans isomerase C
VAYFLNASPRTARYRTTALAFGFGFASVLIVVAPRLAFADDTKVVAKVNGKSITEGDLKLADSEIGSELGSMPEPSKRQMLLEYMIENATMADAAEAARLGTGPVFDARMAFAKRRVLRDIFFEKNVRDSVSEAEAKTFYDEQIKALKPQEELSARHILVDKKELADDIAGKLKAGGDFASLAKQHSKDPGSKENGGDLGFFGRGMMVPPFEEAAFKLAKGEVSAPVQSQFGFHIIRVDDKRTKQAPPFDTIKERLLNTLVGQKAQAISADIRAKATVEILDPDLKKGAEAPKKP